MSEPEPRSPCDYSDDDMEEEPVLKQPRANSPVSPCDYDDDDEDDDGPQEESDEEPEHDPTAADKRKQLLDLKQTLVSTWSAMRKGGVSDRQTFASPVGDWYMTCKLRSTPNNRNLDVVVTRPRGVGGRYRTLNALEDALDEAANSFA